MPVRTVAPRVGAEPDDRRSEPDVAVVRPPTDQAVDDRAGHRRNWSATTWWAVTVFLLVFGVYGLSMGGHTYSVDEETYFAATRALLNGDSVITPTEDVDAVVILVRHKNGELTTAAPIGTLLLFAPFYVAGRAISLPWSGFAAEEVLRLVFLTANSVFTALTAALMVPLCKRLGARLRSGVLLALTYALGTWAWGHAQTGFSEPGSALLLTAAVLASVRWWQHPTLRAAATVGLLVGCAAITRSSLLTFVPVLALAGLVARRDTPATTKAKELLAFGAGGLLPGLAFALNAYVRFGSAFDNGYPPLPFTTPVYEGIFGVFLSPGKGMFWYAPITVVALAGLRQAYLSQRRFVVTVGVLLLVHLAVYGRFEIWSGENAYGPRYMVPVLPLCVALLAPVIDSGRQWVRGAGVAAVVGFFGPGLLGTLMYFNAVYFNTQPDVAGNVDLDVVETTQLHLAWHFQPRSSPLVLHAHSLDVLASNTLDRISGEDGGITEMPVNYEDRIHWYARSVELDTWWAWWPAKNGPVGAYALALVPLACLACGASMARRGFRRARVPRSPAVV